jgi:hypothetical protein
MLWQFFLSLFSQRFLWDFLHGAAKYMIIFPHTSIWCYSGAFFMQSHIFPGIFTKRVTTRFWWTGINFFSCVVQMRGALRPTQLGDAFNLTSLSQLELYSHAQFSWTLTFWKRLIHSDSSTCVQKKRLKSWLVRSRDENAFSQIERCHYMHWNQKHVDAVIMCPTLMRWHPVPTLNKFSWGFPHYFQVNSRIIP